MSPRTVSELVRRDTPLLHADDTIEAGTRKLLAGDLPALPVVDANERFAGIFGEREFMAAVFPGYVKQLKYAGFLSRSLDDVLERNESCRLEPISMHMNTEHVDVGPDFSDLQIAETFLHHRVLIIPVADDREVKGIVTRWDFFKAVGDRLNE
jgi:CBS domain-containing protein